MIRGPRKHIMSNSFKDIDTQLEETTRILREAVDQAAADEAAKADDKGPKKPGSSRGIETMFRTSYNVQMDLTGLADNKANMMISINGIIISIIIASVAPKLDSNPWLIIPTTIFLLGTLVSIVYAILAARPRVSSVPITLKDLEHSRGNILFFGDFANLREQEFVEGMNALLEERNVLYETMIRNLYGLGAVLKKKFALLQIAYTAFMMALVMGVLSFIGVFIWILLRTP
jgi:hypothetical protein